MSSKLSRIFAVLGGLMIAAAVFWAGWNAALVKQAGESSDQVLEQLHEVIPLTVDVRPEPGEATPLPDYVLNPAMPMPEQTVNGRAYIGFVSIPALELELSVASHWDYEALNISPCRYFGSVYTDDLVLSAHNYDSHFGRLNTLQPGDEICFTDVDGNVFHYQVALVELLGSTAVEEMTASGFPLSLFTCTVGGKNRVTVRCERVPD